MQEETIKYLSALSDEELREVLFEVFQIKRPNPEEDKYNHNRFFLGTASILDESNPEQPERWGKPHLHVVADIDRSVSPSSLGPSWGFCQFGTCECGVNVRSNYKQGICPICSAKVSMT
ncbi:hypothetical protein [Chamaesiphon sp.]|uniref:hypothetical protein n=1 Tax=Chamaesiphon sp. TaxID=2814140 RepID=UPI00359485A3